MNIRVAIAGGAGTIGGELLRTLDLHPHTDVIAVHSRSQAGKNWSSTHSDLYGPRDGVFLHFDDFRTQLNEVDVLFLCLGHGESRSILKELGDVTHLAIIDLANDFRLRKNSVWAEHAFAYGLVEALNPSEKNWRWVANPGCFATALQLALIPVANEAQDVFATGITGSTGAGQAPSPTTHFSWRANNVQSYKTLTHQHIPEVLETLHRLAKNSKAKVHFVPWRGDFPRGIHVSCTFSYPGTQVELQRCFHEFYQNSALVHVVGRPVDLKLVVNTNRAAISVDVHDGMAVVHCAIDNLLKGAVGQAIQNMNRVFGLDLNSGLQLKPLAF
jgi:N-acetyl-gamma-glutamyl-phosphate reductase